MKTQQLSSFPKIFQLPRFKIKRYANSYNGINSDFQVVNLLHHLNALATKPSTSA